MGMIRQLRRAAVLAVLAVVGVSIGRAEAEQRGRAVRQSTPAAAQGQQLREGALKPGDLAPDFTLEALGGGPITLSLFRGRQPVALVFGSYT
jgi:hypothetical protein